MNQQVTPGREVLVVEDSKTQALKLRQLLEKWGFSVTVTHDAPSALEWVRSHPPALVISDIVMPGFDGFDLCEAIRQDPAISHLPVVLLTMLSSPSDILRALECGADHFITKPYDEEYLRGRMEGIVASLDRRLDDPAEYARVVFGGKEYRIRLDMQRVLNLLVSSYDSTVLNNRQLRDTQKKLAEKVVELETALDQVKTLQGIIPICMHCKKIRDDKSYWHQLEQYISRHSKAVFSHGICPECARDIYGMPMNAAGK